jgi:energy-coupling factor transporter ATP-binding protein EcfA2
MSPIYSATAKQNPGRKSWLVEFRHPLKIDSNGKPGKKTRKGLGTEDEQEAGAIVEQLNQLLADESLHSVSAQADAGIRFDPKVVEIFYSEITPRPKAAAELREALMPLPGHDKGYAKIALLGVSGAGKTTLLRQLIGTHPDKDRFPSTSVNRTTTCATEIILNDEDSYKAVVTFMSESETRFEIDESLSGAIMKAIDSDEQKVAEALLEKSDMRFRLKYLLGELDSHKDDEEENSYDYDDEDSEPIIEEDAELIASQEEKAQQQALLQDYVSRIVELAQHHKHAFEEENGVLSKMTTEDRNSALDEIEKNAINSVDFLNLSSEILEEVRSKFEQIKDGKFEKTNTGWPKAWEFNKPKSDRYAFLKVVRFFTGISVQSWGKLLTPLVNGIRVSGPFAPEWANQYTKLVLIDTEGLGHKANAVADLPEHTVDLLHQVDVIMLVDSAKNSLTNFAAGKALESIVNTGHTRKLVITFTHMDAVHGDNLKGQAKLNHIFGGVRNVAENQLAKNISTEAARSLLQHLELNTFYVGKIDKADPKPAIPELKKLLKTLENSRPPVFEPVAFPSYSIDNLVLAIQEASKNFRQQWNGHLGIALHSEYAPSHWQSIKALSRRYAEGWDDGFYLRPASNLIGALNGAISRFLENPISWDGNPNEDQKRETVDRIKASVSQKIPDLSRYRLRVAPQPAWRDAYALRGHGSTFERSQRINNIYSQYVPIPDARGDKLAFEFLNEIKDIVMSAISDIKNEVEAHHETN